MDTIKYNASKTVSEFMKSDAQIKVLQGPVAAGKTSACIMEIVRQCKEAGVSTRWGVLWAHRATMIDCIVSSFRSWIGGATTWDSKNFILTLSADDVLHTIKFYAEDDQDHLRGFIRTEFTGVYAVASSGLSAGSIADVEGRIGRFPRMFGNGTLLIETVLPDKGSELEEYVNRQRGCMERFRMPSGLSSEAENIENLCPGYYETLAEGRSEEWVDTYVRGHRGHRGHRGESMKPEIIEQPHLPEILEVHRLFLEKIETLTQEERSVFVNLFQHLGSPMVFVPTEA